MALLELDAVSKTFSQRRGGRAVQAVAGVSLTVGKGETLGLVGESGCGKSTLARLALKLVDVTGGRIRFDGTDVTDYGGRRMLPIRRRLQDLARDRHAAGERDLVDAGMAHERVAGLGTAAEEVEHTWRKARLGEDLRQEDRRERSR